MSQFKGKLLLLCGGVGGAKLALGFSRVLPPEQLLVAVNTADDFEHYGLSISPDLDTVMYTLAGLNDSERGWGMAGESWHCMESLARLGGETWFRLGDRDLATHLERTRRLRRGETLTQVTRSLCSHFGVRTPLLPMSDDPVATMLRTSQGELAFQDYFVREQCVPAISGYFFCGAESARPQPEMMRLLSEGGISAVVICPSNPFVSIEPILALPGVRDALRDSGAPVVAVSPIIAGRAVKGPSAKMMAELGYEVTPAAVAGLYRDLLDGFVIDKSDRAQVGSIEALGVATACERTLMRSLDDRMDLACRVMQFARSLID
ncbi:2-phospho-L-lactate transferase [Pseudohaliea sp.]|uniref:2-phospho-L-lactate transferase n=1 Tax=Pseudohaliea sp. TaxID=2740289 RepID=UPI0032EFE7A2